MESIGNDKYTKRTPPELARILRNSEISSCRIRKADAISGSIDRFRGTMYEAPSFLTTRQSLRLRDRRGDVVTLCATDNLNGVTFPNRIFRAPLSFIEQEQIFHNKINDI